MSARTEMLDALLKKGSRADADLQAAGFSPNEIADAKRGEDIRHERAEKMCELLPTWFTNELLGCEDGQLFGLLLITGKTLGVERIDEIHQDAAGNIWLDVTVAGSTPLDKDDPKYIYAPTKKSVKASINAAHVVTAMDLV